MVLNTKVACYIHEYTIHDLVNQCVAYCWMSKNYQYNIIYSERNVTDHRIGSCAIKQCVFPSNHMMEVYCIYVYNFQLGDTQSFQRTKANILQ